MDIKRPGTPILRFLALIVALIAGVWTWYALAKSQADPAAVRDALQDVEPSFNELAQLELRWLDGHFREELVLAPLAPVLCPDGLSSRAAAPDSIAAVRSALALAEGGDISQAVATLAPHSRRGRDHWPANLVAGQLLLRDGQVENAAEMFDRLLANESMRQTFRDLRAEVNRGRGFDKTRLEGFLALYYASGQARLSQDIQDTELWYALRYAVGACTSLVKGTDRNVVDKEPCRIEQRLNAPGCTVSTMSSYDLYNNLIIGYLQNEQYQDNEAGRQREFQRALDSSPEKNPLAAVLRQARDGWAETDWQSREYWLWAVSNAESLLRANGQRPPRHAHLSFLLAQLVDSAIGDAPPEARIPLQNQRDALIRASRDELSDVLAIDGKSRLASGLVRLEGLSVLRDGSDLEPFDYARVLDGDSREIFNNWQTSLKNRQSAASLVESALGEDGTSLGAAWERTARRDLASALSAIDPELAFGVLAVGDGVPPALKDGSGLGAMVHQLRSSQAGVPVVIGLCILVFLAVLFVGLWFALQMRRRKELFTSFYRRETIARLEGV